MLCSSVGSILRSYLFSPVCVCMSVHTHMHVHVCVYKSLYTYGGLRTALVSSSGTLCSLIRPDWLATAQLPSVATSWMLASPVSLCVAPPRYFYFYMNSGYQIQVLRLVRQVLYWLNHPAIQTLLFSYKEWHLSHGNGDVCNHITREVEAEGQFKVILSPRVTLRPVGGAWNCHNTPPPYIMNNVWYYIIVNDI